ncbi:hypothetical protein QZH41_020632, partial [Actinostola sp. cb2023]
VGSYTNEDEYRMACQDACLKAIVALKEGRPAVDAVAVALTVLETDTSLDTSLDDTSLD